MWASHHGASHAPRTAACLNEYRGPGGVFPFHLEFHRRLALQAAEGGPARGRTRRQINSLALKVRRGRRVGRHGHEGRRPPVI
ncbi:hypothetical protein E2C01_090965 [Portunus trituberculatus]|uniref:Uncharacterized protein n=1 Tax=Portunus trituberculatus TaxID=210409 RepID=A0A5B7JG56_PORTR|nr:hypothetical protein [Portunus trituberculatus]